jgi:hypothetical protein
LIRETPSPIGSHYTNQIPTWSEGHSGRLWDERPRASLGRARKHVPDESPQNEWNFAAAYEEIVPEQIRRRNDQMLAGGF